MKWVVAVALVGLSVAAQQQNKTAEGAVREADGRRSHRRHRGSEESFEDDDYFAPYYTAPQQGYAQSAAAPNGYGAQPAAAGSYGAAQSPQYIPYPTHGHYQIQGEWRSYDVNYCSIHASFPMTGGLTKKDDDESDESDDYSRKSRRRHRGSRCHRHRWNRQTCRFTATFSQETCQTCCRLSSRNNADDPSTISGALMFFAPWDRSSAEKNLKREVQCVCCAPRNTPPQSTAAAYSAAPAAAAPSDNY